MRRAEAVGLTALAVVGGVGCGSDVKVGEIIEETGRLGDGGDDECETLDFGGCHRASYHLDSPALELSGICSLIYDPSDGGTSEKVRFDDLTGFAILGEFVPEPSGLEVKLAFDRNKTNSSDSWPYASDTYRSNAVESTALGSDCWRARTASSEDLGTLRECEADSADGTCEIDLLVVEISDPTRASEGRCDEYVSGRLEICLEGRSPMEVLPTVSTSARFDSAAPCEAGSGLFMLVPTRTVNLDGDERSTSLMRPLMVSGTGALTATARITSIQPRSRLRTQVHILRGDRERWRVGHDDRLTSFGDSVVVLSQGGISLPDGDLLGSSYFVVEEHMSTKAPPVTVSMEWQCREPTLTQLQDEGTADPRPTYWSSPLELGCLGGWAQRIGIQVHELEDRRWLTLSPFGLPDMQLSSRLVTRGGTEQFTGSREGIRVKGAILSESKDIGLVLRLDSVLYRDQPLCSPGTYLLRSDWNHP